jgi:hypothetical protein
MKVDPATPPRERVLMNTQFLRIVMATVCCVLQPMGTAFADQPEAAGVEFFEKQIRPLLVQRCLKCHGAKDDIEGGLSLASKSLILKGGETGPAAVTGKADASLMIQAIGYADELRMPPDGKLPQREIDLLTKWVQSGMPWPEEKETPAGLRTEGEPYKITDAQRQFWSFQPVKVSAQPTVKNAAWPKSDLDRFILAKLEAAGLPPAQAASKRTLIRRATYDLTGLPPTPEEVAAFLHDESSDAFAKVVDRLLDSPQYGEHWGRHWLDVVRYADSIDARQIGQPGDISEAYRYRDWVVNAFNSDLPYDRFVSDQIAGDLIHRDQPDQFAAGLTATSMLAIGRWEQGEADKEKMVTDIVDDQIDVVGRGFLGLTLACARCHDHKFDPIPTEDYYSLAGIFFSSSILPNPGAKAGDSARLRLPLLSPQQQVEREQLTKKAALLQREAEEILGKQQSELSRDFIERLEIALLTAIDASSPNADPEQLAAERNLDPSVLRRLIAWLGMANETQPHVAGLLTEKLTVVHPNSGIIGWGSQATPWVAANPTANVVTAGSLTVPAQRVAVHPSPTQSAAIGWRSPVTET